VVYNKEKDQWMVITTTHEDTHTLAWCSTKADLTSGVHYLECTELVFPHSYTNNKGYNTEDPDFFYDAEAGKWRLAYCALKDKSYVTFLCESDNWNGPYTLIAESNYNNNTGEPAYDYSQEYNNPQPENNYDWQTDNGYSADTWQADGGYYDNSWQTQGQW
jgi:hypothetical protein